MIVASPPASSVMTISEGVFTWKAARVSSSVTLNLAVIQIVAPARLLGAPLCATSRARTNESPRVIVKSMSSPSGEGYPWPSWM